MIRNESEYQEASSRLAEERARFAEHRERLKTAGLNDDEIKRVIDPMESLRIAKGISQRELASRLGVHESQVSRDERNEYHGITLDRANRILEALRVTLHTTVEMDESEEMAVA